MYAAYAGPIDESGLLAEPQECTSDIPFGSAASYLLLRAVRLAIVVLDKYNGEKESRRLLQIYDTVLQTEGGT